jgi:hypothetical protein
MFARVALAAALVGGLSLVPIGPAAATCRPEKPSTCEPVGPHCHVSPQIDRETLEVDPGLYCHQG